MPLYGDYLKGARICHSWGQKLRDKLLLWHLQRKSAKKIRNQNNKEIIVRNKKELWGALRNKTFYRNYL